MLAIKKQKFIHLFLQFAIPSTNLLYIQTEENYEQALELLEYIMEKADDSRDEPLNILISIIANAIEKYEITQKNMIEFEQEVTHLDSSLSTLRLLMQQHNLLTSDFEHEIGSKYLVSNILKGKEKLTKKHIIRLSKKFNVDSEIFF